MVKIYYERQPLDAVEESYSVGAGGSVTVVDMSDTSLWGGLVTILERLEVSNNSGSTATITIGDGTTTKRTVIVPNGETVDLAPEVVEAGSKLVVGSDQAITVNVVKAVLPKDMVMFTIKT